MSEHARALARAALGFALLLAVAQRAEAAKEIDHAYQYKACMALSKRNPDEAFATGLRWRDLGGGDAAEHCVAAALIGLGQYADAARRLEVLAEKAKQNPSVKAGLLAHAAQARLLEGKAPRAEAVLTAALKLTPGDAALLVDRAQARAAQRDYAGAVDDLTEAIGRESRRPDAFVFRATAYRYLDKLELALADIERALQLRPTHPDALLERGIIRRLRRDNAGARADWLAVLRAAPKSPAADAARLNLERMDVKPDR